MPSNVLHGNADFRDVLALNLVVPTLHIRFAVRFVNQGNAMDGMGSSMFIDVPSWARFGLHESCVAVVGHLAGTARECKGQDEG